MIQEFAVITEGVFELVSKWEIKLSALDAEVVALKRNCQNRTIKQITGHMIDSASNNLHRIIHLQYNENPLIFPNYATNGNNDRWIAIQNYQKEDWFLLVQLWKYSNLHIIHVMKNVDPDKLDCKWISAPGKEVSLKDMIMDYLRHLELHLDEIDELINN
ncbi:DinB family protein [Dysgonomonas sp. ZJ709]|uniref:DinB family protein n=1 Tax=Dysgonomonas sp. ZJ709 TaxID=2709797 RepID=UPI0013EAEB35|nr:DinB family protein [Dysgonomonas sp. ZJ709]